MRLKNFKIVKSKDLYGFNLVKLDVWWLIPIFKFILDKSNWSICGFKHASCLQVNIGIGGGKPGKVKLKIYINSSLWSCWFFICMKGSLPAASIPMEHKHTYSFKILLFISIFCLVRCAISISPVTLSLSLSH